MYTWTRRLVVGAALLAGCTGKLSGTGRQHLHHRQRVSGGRVRAHHGRRRHRDRHQRLRRVVGDDQRRRRCGGGGQSDGLRGGNAGDLSAAAPAQLRIRQHGPQSPGGRHQHDAPLEHAGARLHRERGPANLGRVPNGRRFTRGSGHRQHDADRRARRTLHADVRERSFLRHPVHSDLRPARVPASADGRRALAVHGRLHQPRHAHVDRKLQRDRAVHPQGVPAVAVVPDQGGDLRGNANW